MIGLKEQLLQSHPFRIELHAHTNPVSGCSELPPDELIRRCRDVGANGVVVTNHALPDDHNIPCRAWVDHYLADYHRTQEAGEQMGVKVYLGLEMRFPGSYNDYLVYGADEAFVETAWEYLATDLHTFYTACKADNRLIVQAHPFRDGLTRADAADLDGIEVFNMHPGHNSRVTLAAKLQQTVGGVVTGGTDLHHRGHEGQLLTCFRELPEDSFALAKALKAGDYIFAAGNAVILP